jgi:hypothetical protein
MQRIIKNRPQSHRPDFHQQFQLEHRYGFVEDVIDGCCHILERIIHNRVPSETAATAKTTTSTLRFAPFRMFSRMISASIFLLKALALGASKVKLIESLHVLDRAILALRSSNLDEVHLAEQYAELLMIQVSALRTSFESSALFLSSKKKKTTHSSQGHCSGDLSRDTAGQFLSSHQQQNMHSHIPSSFCEGGNVLPAGFHNQHQPDSARTDSVELNHTPVETTATATTGTIWENNLDEWFSLPFDPSMAPFTGWDEQSQSCLSPLNPSWLDVDFIWNLAP